MALGRVQVFRQQFRPRLEGLDEHLQILGIPFAVELLAEILDDVVKLFRTFSAWEGFWC